MLKPKLQMSLDSCGMNGITRALKLIAVQLRWIDQLAAHPNSGRFSTGPRIANH